MLANVNPFTKGIGKGAKKLSAFEKRIHSTGRSIKLLQRTAVGLAGAFAGSKLVSEFLSTAQSIDRLAKTSDKLGIATGQLAALRFAAAFRFASRFHRLRAS